MTTTKKKRVYTGRNTGKFYAMIERLPDYDVKAKETIVDGAIDDFLVRKYGIRHGREVRLSKLSDTEYKDLLSELWQKVKEGKDKEALQFEAIRNKWIHNILDQLTRIGVFVKNRDYTEVNYHIRRLPISKGKILPQINTDKLEDVFKAVCSYCDNILKRQLKEQAIAERN